MPESRHVERWHRYTPDWFGVVDQLTPSGERKISDFVDDPEYREPQASYPFASLLRETIRSLAGNSVARQVLPPSEVATNRCSESLYNCDPGDRPSNAPA